MSQEEILLWQLSLGLNPLFPIVLLIALTLGSQSLVTNLISSRHFYLHTLRGITQISGLCRLMMSVPVCHPGVLFQYFHLCMNFPFD